MLERCVMCAESRSLCRYTRVTQNFVNITSLMSTAVQVGRCLMMLMLLLIAVCVFGSWTARWWDAAPTRRSQPARSPTVIVIGDCAGMHMCTRASGRSAAAAELPYS